MTLYEIFSEDEIAMILEALKFHEDKWRKVYERPYQGFGSAAEKEKKQERKLLSEQYAALQTKICENTD